MRKKVKLEAAPPPVNFPPHYLSQNGHLDSEGKGYSSILLRLLYLTARSTTSNPFNFISFIYFCFSLLLFLN